MQCPVCGRLNTDGLNTCRFCGNVFDAGSPADDIVPNHHVSFEFDGGSPAKKRNPYKSGIAFIASAAVLIIAVVFIAVSVIPSHGCRKAVRNYSVGYYGGNFYDAYDNSAIDLQKVYESNSYSSSNDPFGSFGDMFGGMFGGMFGDMFGFSSGYSSYDEMISAYLQDFRDIQLRRAQQFGNVFKIRADVKKIRKLRGADADSVRSSYINSCGNVLKDGEKGDIFLVSATVKIKGSSSAQQAVILYVLEIGGKPYVMTDTSLNPFFAG